MIIGIFSHFFAVETTLAERQFFRAMARLIGRRAARLSACGIAAIVSHMDYLDEGCSVGADGSLYNVCSASSRPFITASCSSKTYSPQQKYPGFADRIHEGLIDIFGERARYVVTIFHRTYSQTASQKYYYPSRRRRVRSRQRNNCRYATSSSSQLIESGSADYSRQRPGSVILAMTKARKDAGLFVDY